MSIFPHQKIRTAYLFIFVLVMCVAWGQPQAQKTLTFEDVMRFKEIRNPKISEDGRIVVYGTQPGRGDGEAYIHNLGKGKIFRIERGSRPVISNNSRWVGLTVLPKTVDLANAKKDKPKQGMALVNTQTGEVDMFDNVDQFELSEDSKWLAYKMFPDKTEPKEEPDKKTGTTLFSTILKQSKAARFRMYRFLLSTKPQNISSLFVQLPMELRTDCIIRN